MKTISRYIMTLALLITAAASAWAQEPWKSGDCTVTLSNGTLTVSGKGAMVDYTSYTDRPWHDNRSDITSVVVESGVTTVGQWAFCFFQNLTSVTLPEGLTSIGVNGIRNCGKLTSVTIPSTVTSIGSNAFYGCTSVTDVYLYADPANLTWNESSCDDFKQGGYTKCHVLAEHLSAYKTKFSGKVNVTFVGDLKPLPGTMVLNDTKTEASFEMPTYDVTVNYELVRDMSVQMQAQVGDDATKQPRYRVQWNEEKDTFEPADMDMMQVLELFSVYDGIEGTTVAPKNYRVSIYAVDAEGNPTGEAMDFTSFTFAPGRYAVTASAQLDAPYEGTTAPSNIFELYKGYEVTVPAGEYATFYKDENLYIEDEDAEIYTIASVTDTEAVLSDAIKVAPAETPLLVYNKSEQDKTFLLIPTTDDADEVTPATQFVGTLEATTIPASATGADNYALNGYAFVWVKTAIAVGANKCWLHIASQPAAARAMTRSIVGGNGTTGIDAIENVTIDNEGWYDLRGRKLQAKPNRGGIYIHNGKKVVIR